MSQPWYAWYSADYRRKTQHLTMLEDGAYRRLLDYYYDRGGPLQANASILLRVCLAFAKDEQDAVLRMLDEFFTLEADGYHHKRADEELQKQAELIEKRRLAGKKGGLKRVSKYQAHAQANAQANAKHLPTQPQPQYIKNTPCKPPISPPYIVEHVTSISRETPDDLHPLNYAEAILEDLGMSAGSQNKIPVANAITAYAKWRKVGHADAFEGLRRIVLSDHDAGVQITKFYFDDGLWGPNRGKHSGANHQKQQASSADARLARIIAKTAAASGRTGQTVDPVPVGNQGDDGGGHRTLEGEVAAIRDS